MARDAPAVPPEFRIENGHLIVAGMSSDCPMLYDNDWWQDVPDAAYLWVKASQGKCDLRGNIVTRCTFAWEQGYAHRFEEQIDDCHRLLAKARDSGLRNIPAPVLGSAQALRRPESGKIDDTRFEKSQGSELIVAESRKASPEKPLLVFVGGSCTTMATAYLSDPSIAGRTLVFQIDGGAYNGSDGWAWEIVMKRCRFANWARGYFWDKINTWKPDQFAQLPHNPLCDFLRHYAFEGHGKANQWGDGAWIFYLFDHRCLQDAESYDGQAITVPRGATDIGAIEAEFFKTVRRMDEKGPRAGVEP
ncbi:MAG TPA: hypothetical protein VG826_26000 [Pirellulales bacterium]|nr:hypothetical protein [Pirellulales bacterium]